jgi:cell division septum initiation protein DivIVA
VENGKNKQIGKKQMISDSEIMRNLNKEENWEEINVKGCSKSIENRVNKQIENKQMISDCRNQWEIGRISKLKETND